MISFFETQLFIRFHLKKLCRVVRMKKFITSLFCFVLILTTPIFAKDDYTCIVYFTGIGCPHCAKTDPVIFEQLLKEYPNLIVIEYEIYQQQENAYLLYEYNTNYNSGLGIPLIIFNKDNYIVGDTPILESIRDMIESLDGNECPLSNGSSVDFTNLDLTTLPRNPKIWRKNRVLISGEDGNNIDLKKLLMAENTSAVLEEIEYSRINPKSVPLSGKNLKFNNAIKKDEWTFQWNSKTSVSACSCPKPSKWSRCINNSQTRTNYRCSIQTNYECVPYKEVKECSTTYQERQLTLAKIISLAAVDAVNPCALAVLTLMLITIITYNPKNRMNVLLAGLAFTTSVFVMYLFYGLVIIRFFQLIQTLTSIRLMLYKILGFAAVILGILNIKDFLSYKPGGLGTEMPMILRPKVKKIISKVTSPKGAFGVGTFVTVFLLPCTIGPYVIAGGILSVMELMKTIPWLSLYNLIFVSPMIFITLIVYFGITRVEDVSGWKEKNIRYLHLTAGMIIFILGAVMVLGWV